MKERYNIEVNLYASKSPGIVESHTKVVLCALKGSQISILCRK